jgi:hypothetical protein
MSIANRSSPRRERAGDSRRVLHQGECEGAASHALSLTGTRQAQIIFEKLQAFLEVASCLMELGLLNREDDRRTAIECFPQARAMRASSHALADLCLLRQKLSTRSSIWKRTSPTASFNSEFSRGRSEIVTPRPNASSRCACGEERLASPLLTLFLVRRGLSTRSFRWMRWLLCASPRPV